MPSFEMPFLSGLIIKPDKNGISQEGIKTSISNLAIIASHKRA
jgi:hypothetical protein